MPRVSHVRFRYVSNNGGCNSGLFRVASRTETPSTRRSVLRCFILCIDENRRHHAPWETSTERSEKHKSARNVRASPLPSRSRESVRVITYSNGLTPRNEKVMYRRDGRCRAGLSAGARLFSFSSFSPLFLSRQTVNFAYTLHRARNILSRR